MTIFTTVSNEFGVNYVAIRQGICVATLCDEDGDKLVDKARIYYFYYCP